MDEKTQSKGSCNCTKVRIKLRVEGEVKRAISNDSDEGDEDEKPIEEDKVDGKFEKLHEKLYIFPPDERNYHDNSYDTSILNRISGECDSFFRCFIVADCFCDGSCDFKKVAADQHEISDTDHK